MPSFVLYFARYVRMAIVSIWSVERLSAAERVREGMAEVKRPSPPYQANYASSP